FVVASNFSYGIDEANPDDFPIWCDFYDNLGEAGILNCVATTNQNVNIDDVGDMPTNCSSPYLIGVTSSTMNDTRAVAGFGVTNIDVAAPGNNVLLLDRNGNYREDRGTSFATPVVAGLLGLAYAAPCADIDALATTSPRALADKMRDALYSGVDVIPSMAGEVATGGRVNAVNTLNAILAACATCPNVVDVALNNVNLNDVQVSWNIADPNTQIDLRFREVNTQDWNTNEDVMSPFMINGLSACTEYEIEFRSVCQDSTTDWENNTVFTTDGCCEAPEELFYFPEPDSGRLTISWNPVTIADNYTFQFRIQGVDETFTERLLADTAFILEPLMPCMVYEFIIASNCTDGDTVMSDTIVWANDDCMTCTDRIYCGAEGRDASLEWIESVTFNGNVRTTGNDGGYGDYAGAPVIGEIVPGFQNTITITPGYAQDSFPEQFALYIDVNYNGVFDTSELILVSLDGLTGAYTGTFTFPRGTPLGITRLRIMMQAELQALPFDPCRDFQFGEVEDYCVKIFFPEECTPPIPDTVSTAGGTAVISWDSVPWDLVYTIRFREVGEEEWTEEALLAINQDTGVYELMLDGCTEYEFQVRAICPNDSSAYSESLIVQSADCRSSGIDIESGLEFIRMAPNPFRDQINLTLKLLEPESIRMSILNTSGANMVNRLIEVTDGVNEIPIPLDGLSSGIYIMVLESKEGKIFRKIIKE
ncbi:MAG: GEVED domain-containing protein, partial [Bacteroidota bacterium]